MGGTRVLCEDLITALLKLGSGLICCVQGWQVGLLAQCGLTHLMLIRYCARATDSAFPVMVMVRSMLPPIEPRPPPPVEDAASRSSQLEMRIIAPLSWLDGSVKDLKVTIGTGKGADVSHS